MDSIDVGILGATGMVGQQFIALLAHHPWFKVAWLGASERSAGKAYRDATAWRMAAPLSEGVARMGVDAATPGRAPRLVFSGPIRRSPARSSRLSPKPATSSSATRGTTGWKPPCPC